MNDNMKENIKAKGAAVKAKLKGVKEKAKGAKKCAAFAAALGFAAALSGCASANPASRANESQVGDIKPTVKIVLEGGACSNVVNVTMPITLGDGVLASADSSGSTETQTATPTLDIRTRIDARYNDALAAASPVSKDVLGSLTTAGADKVLSMMASKETGTVEVQKKDGTTATVKCENGQCEFCEDPNAK